MKGPYLGVEKVAEYFGVSISTIRQWVRAYKIPQSAYLKVGNTYRFHLRATEDALLNYDSRKELSKAERDKLAEDIILGLLADTVMVDLPKRVPPEEVEKADKKLEEQVTGVPHIEDNPEMDEAIDSILDDDDLQDL